MATQAQLTEAEAALHKVVVGKQVAEVRKPDGSTVKFSQTNMQELRAYINQLKYELGLTTTPRRRAIGVRFS